MLPAMSIPRMNRGGKGERENYRGNGSEISPTAKTMSIWTKR